MTTKPRALTFIGDRADADFWIPIIIRAAVLDKLGLVEVDPDPWLTTSDGAELVGRRSETVRQWVVASKLGRRRWNADERCWEFKRSGLINYLVARFGVERLPAALRNLGPAQNSEG